MYILENFEPRMVNAQEKKTFSGDTLTIPSSGAELGLGTSNYLASASLI
jgi:hypothetical protein